MIRVTDLDVSLDFYYNKLGFVEVKRNDYKQGRFSLFFLAASGDEGRAREENAPVIELAYNWDKEKYDSGLTLVVSLMRLMTSMHYANV